MAGDKKIKAKSNRPVKPVKGRAAEVLDMEKIAKTSKKIIKKIVVKIAELPKKKLVKKNKKPVPALNKAKPAKKKLSAPGRARRAKTSFFIDTDSDGLSDYQEELYGTNPQKADSDGDGLSDYDEIKVYQTDPLEADTNKNGVPDGEEVKKGQNPRGDGTLKDIFLPYAGNDYQPHFLKPKRVAWYAASAIMVKTIIVLAIFALPISAWVTPDVNTKQAEKIITLTNEVRQHLGVAPLKENSKLVLAAIDKAQDMLIGQYFAHISPNPPNKSLNDWLKKNSYSYETAGENLAMGFSGAEDVVNAWTKSKTHYANMIDPDFTEIGVGLISGSFHGYDTTLVAQMFGRPDKPNKTIVNKPVASNPVLKALSTSTPVKNIISIASSQPAKSKPVLGEKITVALTKPVMIYPSDGFLTKAAEVDVNVFAPEAEKVFLVDGGNQQQLVSASDGRFLGRLTMAEGENKIYFKSVKGNQEATSSVYSLTADRTAPVIDAQLSKVMFTDEAGQNRRLVRAEVYESGEMASGEVAFGSYQIKLSEDPNQPGKWTGSTIVFEQNEEQLFSPVILPSVTVADKLGNTAVYDLNWENIVPVKPSLLDQYFFAKDNKLPDLKWLFGVSRIYYQALLGLAAIVLLLNIIIKIKKQNPKTIITGLSLIILLVFLILI